MKNSFFLIIPEQQNNPDRLQFFEPAALKLWLMELPTANPGLSTRLFHDFISEFNSLEMDPQFRLDTLELLRPSFKTVESYLFNSILNSGFPKVENEVKIHQFLIAIEKEFTVGYWIVVKELTSKNISWFQSKTVGLAIQRVIKGLSSLVVSHHLMYMSVPEWVWMDLHSLNKLCTKIKKETTKVQDDTCLSNTSSPLDSYKQILLFALADPASLQQKEILQVYQFCEHLLNAIKIVNKPVSGQETQCVILQDEDKAASFLESSAKTIGVAVLYVDLKKLPANLRSLNKYVDDKKMRFTTVSTQNGEDSKLSLLLLENLKLKWSGKGALATAFFKDQEQRLFCIGLNATYNFQTANDLNPCTDLEYPADPSSDRFLSCQLNSTGILAIGSLISFRKQNSPQNKRSLGVVCNLSQKRSTGKLNFAVQSIAAQAYPVTFLRINAAQHVAPQKAMIFGQKEQGMEKSFLIVESSILNDFELLRLFMNNENFPIILRDKKNIGLGFWKFECRRLEEHDLPKS